MTKKDVMGSLSKHGALGITNYALPVMLGVQAFARYGSTGSP